MIFDIRSLLCDDGLSAIPISVFRGPLIKSCEIYYRKKPEQPIPFGMVAPVLIYRNVY